MAKIVDVIKYEGDNNTLIWKHPAEDFNTLSQLIVHESQEAIFMINGQALDTFGPGRHTLTTQNLPLVGNVVKLVTDGESPFHCEVYYVNKTEQLDIRWGTDSKVSYMDPVFNIPLEIGANGSLHIKVNDGRKLLIKLVGTTNDFTHDHLSRYFRSMIMTEVKSYLAQAIINSNLGIFTIDSNLKILSDALCDMINPIFEDYGITLTRFNIVQIVKPEDDPEYIRLKKVHSEESTGIREFQVQQRKEVMAAETRAQSEVIEAQGRAQRRNIEGYSYQDERMFDVAQSLAQNEGTAGQMAGLGVGIGTMAGIGGAVGGMVNNAFSGGGYSNGNAGNSGAANNQETTTCKNCGATIPKNAKFCIECGEKNTSDNMVVCPSCGKTVSKGKFCIECGYKFVKACPKCGAEIENGKFCPECGTKVEA